MKDQYQVRKETDGTWTVFNIFTGWPVIMVEREMTGMKQKDADELAEMLNGLSTKRPEHPLP